MLEGERVRIRPLREEDTERLWEFWSDLDMSTRASNQPPRPYTLEETKAFFAELSKKEDLYRFAIEAEGELVGDCSLHDLDRHNRTTDVGISLGKPYWSKGYGQEALSLLVDYAFKHHNLHRVSLEVLADDDRAVNCYRKVGFIEEGRIRQRDWRDGSYHDVLIMGILVEEWT